MASHSLASTRGRSLVLAFALTTVSSLLAVSGCAISPDESSSAFAAEPAQELCGGAVCFPANHTAVSHWGDGEVTVIAYRADDLGCEAPHLPTVLVDDAADGPSAHDGTQAKSTRGSFVSGRMIELKLHAPKQGARVAIVSHDMGMSDEDPSITARAMRIGEDGRMMASEEAVSGEATILELDPHTGRVLVKLEALWSSGVRSDLRLEIEGPQTCATGT